MRGVLGGNDPLSAAIARLSDNWMHKENIFIPSGTPSNDLAWDFNGKVKFLDECSKEELLYVCQVLCQKLQSNSNITAAAA